MRLQEIRVLPATWLYQGEGVRVETPIWVRILLRLRSTRPWESAGTSSGLPFGLHLNLLPQLHFLMHFLLFSLILKQRFDVIDLNRVKRFLMSGSLGERVLLIFTLSASWYIERTPSRQFFWLPMLMIHLSEILKLERVKCYVDSGELQGTMQQLNGHNTETAHERNAFLLGRCSTFTQG